MSVGLLWLGDAAPPAWELGPVLRAAPTPAAVSAAAREALEAGGAAAWLFWDGALGAPEPEAVLRALSRPGELWHAGLRMGMGGLPGALDFVSPIWMLNRDPDAGVEATSWRLSLRACLVRAEVLRQMGGVEPAFRTLEAASLELGHRCVTRGVVTRHLPWLLPAGAPGAAAGAIPFEDEARFVLLRHGRRWARWAALRAVATGYASPGEARRALGALAGVSARQPAPFRRDPLPAAAGRPSVSVLLPTLDRYPYLRTVLRQLREQTVAPGEVIVVDQTPPERRGEAPYGEFADLPLRVVWLERAGQCSSRNLGMGMATGECILLLDDDIEMDPGFVARHLDTLEGFGAGVSSGVSEEVGAGPLPEAFTFARASDVFPAGITLVRREALQAAGLFDLAYERRQQEDGDLGMRIYLTGALMVLNPEIRVLHHRAPRGGLRAHGARVVTYASSRSRLLHRHLPDPSEIYLARRFFTARQQREALLIRALGTLRGRGGPGARALKALLGAVRLPGTLLEFRRRARVADEMMQRFPEIPALDSETTHTAA